MQISATGTLINANKPMRKCLEQGFTLLEMMLVVVLIGLTVGFVNLNLSPDAKDVLEREANRIVALLKQLQDESVISGKPMAMELNELDQEYFFLVPGKDGWIPLVDDELFRTRSIARSVNARLEVEGFIQQNSDDLLGGEAAIVNPRLIVDPEGGVTRFVLHLAVEKSAVTVTLNERAQFVLKRVEDST